MPFYRMIEEVSIAMVYRGKPSWPNTVDPMGGVLV